MEKRRFFQDLAKKNKKLGIEAFLMTPEGEEYAGMFRKLRLPQLINHSMDMEMLVTGENESIEHRIYIFDATL